MSKYPLINIKDIFVYKALPAEMKHRVIALPSVVKVELPPATGFPKVDETAKIQAMKNVDWQHLPERNLTQCGFIDALMALIHQYGNQTSWFYTDALDNGDAVKLNNAVQMFAGIPARELIVRYTLLMIRDLRQRTDLSQKEIAQLLHFPSPQSFNQFMCSYGKKQF